MKFQGMKASTAVLILACGATLRAQTGIVPGQLAAAPKVSVSGRSYAIAPNGGAERTSIASVKEVDHDKRMNRLWIGSIVAMLGATSFDAATSMGKYEANGLLASSNGKFGQRGLEIKAAAAAAVLVPQILLVRKHKELRSKFALANLIEAGVFSGVAAHNLGIAAPKN